MESIPRLLHKVCLACGKPVLNLVSTAVCQCTDHEHLRKYLELKSLRRSLYARGLIETIHAARISR